MDLNLDRFEAEPTINNGSIFIPNRGMYSVEGCDLPIEFYDGEISEEGWISNIVEWFRKKREEARARRKAMEKQQWQNYLEACFYGYADRIESMPKDRLAAKEVSTYKYDECVKQCENTAAIIKAFLSMKPISEKSFISFLKQIETKVKPYKPTIVYNKEDDSVVYNYLQNRKVVKLKGSKWDNPAAVKALYNKVMVMDELYYQWDEVIERVVAEYNAWAKDKPRSQWEVARKCLVCWCSYSSGAANLEAATCKQLIANMNSILN